MQPGSPLIDGAGDDTRTIATDGGVNRHTVAVGNDDGISEADSVMDVDGGDDGS